MEKRLSNKERRKLSKKIIEIPKEEAISLTIPNKVKIDDN